MNKEVGMLLATKKRANTSGVGKIRRQAKWGKFVVLENGSDLHVNERQKIRQYRGRSTGE